MEESSDARANIEEITQLLSEIKEFNFANDLNPAVRTNLVRFFTLIRLEKLDSKICSELELKIRREYEDELGK